MFITPLHRDNETERGEKVQNLCDFVNALREVAQYYSVPLLDLYRSGGMCAWVEEQNKLYFDDGLHPNDTGYARIAKKLADFLMSL